MLLLSLQSCPTLCDPTDDSPPGSAGPGILQARTLEWVATSFSSAWKWKVEVKSLSFVQLFATPWTAAHQAPSSMGFSRQENWSGVSLPSPMIIIDKLKHILKKELCSCQKKECSCHTEFNSEKKFIKRQIDTFYRYGSKCNICNDTWNYICNSILFT